MILRSYRTARIAFSVFEARENVVSIHSLLIQATSVHTQPLLYLATRSYQEPKGEYIISGCCRGHRKGYECHYNPL